MIDYSYTKRPAKRPANVPAIPRTDDGRISYSHPRRAEVGAIVLGPGQSVTLNSNGGRTITNADGTSRTVFPRKQ
jgi:hypothetical protein